MKVHEYQAKSILARYGVAVPRGEVTDSPAEAREIAHRLGGRCVVKAQIHAGGRGKGGGVKLAKDPDEAYALAKTIVGMTLVTPQTGPARPRRPEGPDRRGARHRSGALPGHHARPRPGTAGDDGLEVRAGWRSRRSRPGTRKPSCARCSIRAWGCSRSRRASSPSRSDCPATASRRGSASCRRSSARTSRRTPRSPRSTRSS